MAKKDRPAKPEAPPNVQRGGGLFGVRKLVTGLAGAKLCYGDPIRAGERVVIPVSRVHAAGGGGFGLGQSPDGEGGEGGGGGGMVEAAPVGFIDIGPEGARFEAIPDPLATARALRHGATGLTTLAALVSGLAAMRRHRRGATSLPKQRRLLGR